MTLAEQLARCDREIAEIRERPDVVAGIAPAWLVTLGIEDWEAEKRLLTGRDPAGVGRLRVDLQSGRGSL